MWAFAAGLLLVAGVMLYSLWTGVPESLSPDILERSEAYVKMLDAKPLANLPAEDRLLLLHAHFNLKHYARAAEIANGMIDTIADLPIERLSAFSSMVADACVESKRTDLDVCRSAVG